jgi:hypothetical protein
MELPTSIDPDHAGVPFALNLRSLLAVAALAISTCAHAQQLSPGAERDFAEYEKFSPHKAFALSPDGKTHSWQAGRSGADPSSAIEIALKRCSERSQITCQLYAVNNIVLNGRDWKTAASPLLPEIGRLRPQPWWLNRGPQSAAGLIVWSHGYLQGTDSTNTAPQPYVGPFTNAGYDLYRFDRKWIHDQPGDATAFANAVRQAKSMGYRRIILSGQSNGAWQSLAAVARGAPADGVISMAAALNKEITPQLDVSVLRSDWQQLTRNIKTSARLVVVNFAGDTRDVGGRMEDARRAFSAARIDALVLDAPEGFKGHDAANESGFARKYGPCIKAFIETEVRRPPCR